MKRLNVSNAPPYPQSDGRCSHFTDQKNNNLSIVTIGQHAGKVKPLSVVGLLVHEAMHVWRQIREIIGEQYPSLEFEAYYIQAISQELIRGYEMTRGRLFRK